MRGDGRWLREFDVSIEAGMAEMQEGGGIDLDDACDAMLAELRKAEGRTRR